MKPDDYAVYAAHDDVAPLRERELKLILSARLSAWTVAPLRERELKPDDFRDDYFKMLSLPYGSVN